MMMTDQMYSRERWAVEGFDGGIAIENPGGIQSLTHALGQGRVHPGRALRQLGRALGAFNFRAAGRLVRRQMGQRPAQAFIADDFGHAQNLRSDRIAAQARNMRITPLPVQDR